MLNKINTIVTENLETNKTLDIISVGDFNFPCRIMNWESSNERLFADYVEGEYGQKQDFQLALDFTYMSTFIIK